MKKKSKKKQKQQRQLLLFGGIGGVVLIAAVALIVVILSNASGIKNATAAENTPIPQEITTQPPTVDSKQAEVDSIIYRSTMLEGTKIQGVDVSNMTKDEAKAALMQNEQSLLGSLSILIKVGDDSHTLSSENVVVALNYDKAIDEAFNLVRTDSGYDSVMADTANIKANGHNIDIAYSFDEQSVRAYVAGLATETDTPAVNATVSASQSSTELVYSEERLGAGIDQENLVSSILAASSGATIEAQMVELQPSLTVQMLKDKYVLRATFTTSFKGSSSNRKYNIKKGAEMMNGTVLRPGEVFSCNDKLGVRTSANGWKMAGAYVQGNVDEQAGGGVCQLSSTLYNAVVMADLKIVNRQNHSMPVSYVDKGRDATINSVGNIIDFKFENSTDSDLVIIAFVDGNKVTFELYGVPFATDEYDRIDIRTERISKTEIKEEVTEDPTKDVGYEEITQEGTTGYVYKAYKQYYKGTKMVREELLNNSTYKMYPTKKIVGTKATPEPSLPPSTDPTSPVVTPNPTDPGETPYIPEV